MECLSVVESWNAFKSIGFLPKIHHLQFFGVDEFVFNDEFLLVSSTLAGFIMSFIHSKKSPVLKAMESFSVQVIGFFISSVEQFSLEKTTLRFGYSVDFSCSGCSWVHRAQFSMQCSLILINGPEGYLVTLSLMFDVLGLVGSWKVEHGRNNQSQWFKIMAGIRNQRKHQESSKQSEQLSIYEGFLAAIWYWKPSSHPVMFMEVLCNNWWPGMVWVYGIRYIVVELSLACLKKKEFVKSMPLGAFDFRRKKWWELSWGRSWSFTLGIQFVRGYWAVQSPPKRQVFI